MTSFNRNTEHRIASLLAGGVRTARALSETLTAEGHRACSPSQVKRYLAGLRGGPSRSRAAPPPSATSTPASVAPPVPSIEQERAARRLQLEVALDAAETPTTFAAAMLARLRHDDAELDGYLDRGASLVDALVSAGHDALLVLNRPEHFGELARRATEDVLTWARDEQAGETEEQYAAWLAEQRAAGHDRAVALLEGALAIVRRGAP